MNEVADAIKLLALVVALEGVGVTLALLVVGASIIRGQK